MRYLGLTMALLALLLAPNLVWLARSTVRIENTSAHAIDAVAYVACDTTHAVGTLGAGQSVFRLLPACGDDTLEIVIGDSKISQLYVEGELYHVDVSISGADEAVCHYADPFSSLFVAKAIW